MRILRVCIISCLCQRDKSSDTAYPQSHFANVLVVSLFFFVPLCFIVSVKTDKETYTYINL